MSFEPRDYLRHIVVEADYLIAHSSGLTWEIFSQDETLRRAFVRSGVVASAGVLSGCRTALERTNTASPRRVDLTPVDVSFDRIIRTTVGLRPYRESGFVVRGESLEPAKQFAEHLAGLVKEQLLKRQPAEGPENRLLGPAPAPIPRLRGMYRFHMQVQSADGPSLRAAIRAATSDLLSPDGLQWTVDIDPIDML